MQNGHSFVDHCFSIKNPILDTTVHGFFKKKNPILNTTVHGLKKNYCAWEVAPLYLRCIVSFNLFSWGRLNLNAVGRRNLSYPPRLLHQISISKFAGRYLIIQRNPASLL